MAEADPYAAIMARHLGSGPASEPAATDASATAPASPPADDPYAPILNKYAGAVQPTQPPPEPSIGRSLGLGVRDVAQGAASLPAALLDLATWPGRAIQRAAGVPTTAPSDLVTKGLDATGLPQPQTAGEQIASSGIQGAASVLPTMGTAAIPGLVARLPGMIPALVNRLAGQTATFGDVALQGGMAGAGGATGEAGAELVPDPAKPYVRMGAGLAGAYGAGKVASVGGKAANAYQGETSPTAAAYDRLNIQPRLIGDVTGSPTAQTLQAYGSVAPISSAVVGPVERSTVGQFSDAVEGTARMLGTSQNATAAGDVLQSEARNWKDVVFPARQQAAWAPVDQVMAGAAVDPSGYRGALANLTSKLAALPETQKALLPPRVQTMLDAINADVPAGATMTWPQAQQLRSAIGNVMGVPEIVQSVGKDQLKAAYGGISGDMRRTAAANGAEALFDNANKVSTDGHAFIDNTLSKAIRANNPAQETIAPDAAADNILRGGDATLQAVRQEMPRAADELAAYKLRDMAMATPGKAGASGGDTSVSTFLTDYNKLRQGAPNGAAALYSAPDVAQRMRDLSTVADSIRETALRANVSRTGPYLSLAGLAPAAYGGYEAAGVKGAISAVVAPLIANRLLGSAVTNPTITRLAATPTPALPINPLLAGAISDIPGNQRR